TEQQGLEESREALLGLLRRYQRDRGHQFTVVFDGTATHERRIGGIRVVFAPSADAALARMASPGMMVVSSDNEVARSAERSGATSCSSEAFWERLAYLAGPRTRRERVPPYVAEKGDDEGEEPPRSKKGAARRLSRAERQRRARLNKL
ncbi:MAG: NYN domain-containing protein, partial [Firmicutes bacterium]|nr:NYN domain-containing protein [Bacillota bacterium]